MITSSGAKCDVCGNYILPLDPDELVNTFSVSGIKESLHCDNACKQKLINCGSDWELLPEGPLKKAFETAKTKIERREVEDEDTD